ncbi:hypothetical protein PILCRDRAFT_820047 [Piloderma croceum F 1598]|uniref:Uncharacterized protein n=1 Tax=Piloderma croceum (strain F 1598) TaxID=765440 RepID=A0A0C3FE96_PILCF|nr:hypothetical protein PILCRDRAFT_820047 [Piloderma croceum F 1598]
MHKCHELSRLPKAKSIKSIKFRRTTPGCVQELLGCRSPEKTRLVDESHPAAKLRPRYPRFSNAHITIRAFPKAVLGIPEVIWPDPPFNYLVDLKWSERLEALRKTAEEGEVADKNADLPIDKVNMSLTFVVGKKAVHKNAVVRKRIVRRIKTVISLIVTRGADVERIGDTCAVLKETTGLILNNDANINPHQWIAPGWTYSIIPTLSIYRMPYPELVSILRDGLGAIHTKIGMLEARWISEANLELPKQQTAFDSRPQPPHQELSPSSFGPPDGQPMTKNRITKTSFGLKPPSADLKSAPPVSPPPSSSRSPPTHPYEVTVPSIRVTRTPFGLRFSPVPTADSPMKPPSQATSTPTPIPRLFFPTFPPNSDTPPSADPSSNTNSSNIPIPDKHSPTLSSNSDSPLSAIPSSNTYSSNIQDNQKRKVPK